MLIGDRDEVGSIQISSLFREEGEFLAEEVAEIARENAEVSCDWQAVTLGDFSGIVAAYSEDDSAVREWYLASGSLLLFVTYCCELENAGMDDAAVDDILDTLQLISS